MEILLTAVAVISLVLLLLSAFLFGYRYGRKVGDKAGMDTACKDLILAKNPELWEASHYLHVEQQVKEATTALVRRPGVRPTPPADRVTK